MNAPTPAEIAAARTPQGGWNRETLERWGVPWPPPKGWRRSLERDAGIPDWAEHPIERPCSTCGAEPGQACEVKKGARKAYHRARGGRRRSSPLRPFHGLKTESPIENKLVGAIRGWIDHHEANASLATQMPVGPFRADILVEAGGRKLAVECDGAAFHNNAEAVERDRRRDRYFTARGVAVMRFSGAEITRDQRGCAAQVGMWIMLR